MNMKAKKLITLAIPVMLLGGCVTINTDSKDKKEESQQVDKKTESKKEDSLSVAKGEENKTNTESKETSSNSSNNYDTVLPNQANGSSAGSQAETDKSQARTGVFVGTKGTSEELGINPANMKKYIKDGTELVGNYGIDYGNGVKTTLVLKGDKTFETYGMGSYPSKQNYITGTYKVDVPSLQLSLKISKAIKDGQEVKLTNDSVMYKIQNYDGNTLQIYHMDGNIRIRYVKN